MRMLNRLFARVWNFAFGRRGDERLREELEGYVAMQAQENVRAGMTPTEARRQALLKLGAVEAIREQYHEEEGLPLLEHLLYDFRYALRQLRKSPGGSMLKTVRKRPEDPPSSVTVTTAARSAILATVASVWSGAIT